MAVEAVVGGRLSNGGLDLPSLGGQQQFKVVWASFVGRGAAVVGHAALSAHLCEEASSAPSILQGSAPCLQILQGSRPHQPHRDGGYGGLVLAECKCAELGSSHKVG